MNTKVDTSSRSFSKITAIVAFGSSYWHKAKQRTEYEINNTDTIVRFVPLNFHQIGKLDYNVLY